jgi:hypothetical protein
MDYIGLDLLQNYGKVFAHLIHGLNFIFVENRLESPD